MRSANTVLEQLVLHVRAPRGIAIVLIERPSGYQNWVASTGIMDTERTTSFAAKVAELQKSDQKVDWSKVESFVGPRRVALWFSEVEPRVQPDTLSASMAAKVV
jgi:hypothetical protein